MNKLTAHTLFLFGFLIILGIVSSSYCLQYIGGFIPCPLCALQRYLFIVLAVLMGLGIVTPKNRLWQGILSGLLIFIGTLGILLASRHVWIQHFPAETQGCDASLRFMLEVLPLKQFVQHLYAGGIDCTKVEWRFLTFSIAEWSLLCFTGVTLLSVMIFKRRVK